MKNFKTLTAVLTSVLSVASVYTFSYFMVEKVDDVDLSAESFYSTSEETVSSEIKATTFEEIVETVLETYKSTKPNTTTEITTETSTESETELTTETSAEITSTTVEKTTAETTATTKVTTKVETTATTTVPVTTTKEETSTKTATTTTTPTETEASIIVIEDYSETTTATTEEETATVLGTLPTNYNPFYQASVSASIAAEAETNEDPKNDPEIDSTTVTTEETSIASVLDFKDDNAVTTSTSIDNSASNAVSSFTVKINGYTKTVDAYTLVCEIVNCEMGSSFNTEALKAQAIASYSYLVNYQNRGSIPSVLTKSNPSQKIKDAVSEVFGITCYYNGKAAQTTYYASSSGYTASANKVWGSYYPYLVSVRCEFDETSDPNYGYTKSFSESKIKSSLESSLGIILSDDPTKWFTIISYCDGNYVDTINIDGQVNITGRRLRESILNYDLKSAAFDISYADGNFVFTTYGYGHGVGMSQNGANILAKQGYSYEEILNHYYTGIDIL